MNQLLKTVLGSGGGRVVVAAGVGLVCALAGVSLPEFLVILALTIGVLCYMAYEQKQKEAEAAKQQPESEAAKRQAEAQAALERANQELDQATKNTNVAFRELAEELERYVARRLSSPPSSPPTSTKKL